MEVFLLYIPFTYLNINNHNLHKYILNYALGYVMSALFTFTLYAVKICI